MTTAVAWLFLPFVWLTCGALGEEKEQNMQRNEKQNTSGTDTYVIVSRSFESWVLTTQSVELSADVCQVYHTSIMYTYYFEVLLVLYYIYHVLNNCVAPGIK